MSKTAKWASGIMFFIAVAFLLFDVILHLMNGAQVADATMLLGYPAGIMVTLGIIQLICLIFYVIPRTSVFGAVLLTGYLGGAIATHVRIGSPLWSTILFPVYLGILIWGALYLRNAALRALFPIRRSQLTN